MRWSPHSTGDRRRFLLVDVADSSLRLNEIDRVDGNKVQYHKVAHIGKLQSFGAFDWSRTDESIVALGLVSGNASLVKFDEDKGTAEIVTTFRIKQQRKCNSIAFSKDNWLACALDKTRSDVCLNIYDAGSDSQAYSEPIRRLCPAELVSSVRFFPHHPQEVVLAAQRSFVRLYDLRDPHTSSGATLQATTRNVNNITIDPLDEHYFASAGSTDDPSVTVWDKRWLANGTGGSSTGAVFDFRPAVNASLRTTVWSIRYSGQKRGRLAICSSTGELRLVDMVEGTSHASQLTPYVPPNHYGSANWSYNRFVCETRSLEQPWHDEHHGRPSGERIVAFDWMQGQQTPAGQDLLVLRPNRSLDVLHATTARPCAETTSRLELSLAYHDVALTGPKLASSSVKPNAPYETAGSLAEAEDFGPLQYSGEMTASFTEDSVPCLTSGDERLAKILASGTRQRERCRQGYGLDCRKNMQIVAGNWQLERLWEIINRFKEQATDGSMVQEALDLSYVGVSDLWSERPGNSPNRQLLSSPVAPEDAMLDLNERKGIPQFEGERTDFPEHRQTCLAVCGWKYTIDTLEAECQELIDRGLYYQAIVQAVLHDYRHVALNLLRTLIRSKTIPNNGLGALLAADRVNEQQREMCMWMAADTDDPALKALLTYLYTGDWRDVMKTNYLHLGYRVALGLKYLNDTELSGFIQSETARAIRNGDLEGVLLTGLGPQAMDLFQTYITRTNDLQTAVLATAFTNPLYVDDVRWDLWKETYFDQMQTWRLFNQRAMFTMQHSHLARTREGNSTLQSPAQQVTLRCTECQAPVARHAGGLQNVISAQKPVPKPPKTRGPSAHAGTVCQKCGRHMPRCAICKFWLGTPEVRKQGSSADTHDRLSRFEVFCAACGHGYHAEHAARWFNGHEKCAVPGCDCACSLKS